MIQTYYNHVMGKLDDNSPAYVKGRFAAVKSILQYGIDFTDDTKDCRQALDCCGVLVAPTTAAKPEPMSAEHFNALLSLADTRLKAMMLLALNCAMHGGEATATKRDEIDLDARTFSADRSKTGIRRVAKLWQRTVDAIRQYQAEHPHKSNYLFVSRNGKPLTGESLRQLFVTLRTTAKVPESVTFEGIRDGAYTQAHRVNPVYARWVGGHAAWTNEPSPSKDMANRYAGRDPNDPNVIACCEAIERHYFGNPAPKLKKGGKGKS